LGKGINPQLLQPLLSDTNPPTPTPSFLSSYESTTMVLHHTPYVTPHILHKNYAQAFDYEVVGGRKRSPAWSSGIHLIYSPVIGKDLEFYSQAGFDMDRIQLKRNAPVSLLYEDAIRNEGAIISSSGALINFSGKKTGRSPKDKRIVYEETSKDDIWWGSVNIKLDERKLYPRPNLDHRNRIDCLLTDTFEINRERAIDYLNTRDNVYIFDGFAGVRLTPSFP
jgi:phosphoenolpyruvate carboxykinase (ATP)